ncbi:MAG: short-chain fatty acid transporter [Bacteroidetes bacterium GWF2_33_16]|nr:MAG: short-chain fatty acid transporter [Bacteroidetes bacterium GWE2_32_14]OFY03191.1 MAG: short-chain fatty acid transporter [Bacteroidetes bacterium GWF2_33_16]
MKKKRQFPHTYVIIFSIIVICAILTWVVPGGEFAREIKNINGIDREVIVPGSFNQVDNQPQSWQIFTSIFQGMKRTYDIIFYILMIGGAFWLMNESKALDVAIYSFLNFTKRIERFKVLKLIGVNNLVIILIMVCFSFFGAVIGMSEETIAFVIIFVPLAISMGYDSIVGICLCFLGAGLGFASALLNPFTIGIAQGLSGIQLFSGIEYRFVIWLIINSIGIGYVLWYANRIKKNPKLSPVYEIDEYWRKKGEAESNGTKNKAEKSAWMVFIFISIVFLLFSFYYPITHLAIGNSSISAPIIPILTAIWVFIGIMALRHSVQLFIVNILIFTILFLIIGVMGYGWYIKEIATLFLVMGLLSGISFGQSANQVAKSFIEGAKDIMSAALVVGLASGIVVILEQGKIIDSLLFYASESMQGYGKLMSVAIMFIFYNLLNFIIASGSAKAALTIPLMSQFSDLIGISRQATVTIYQLGGGFTNLITPTSGVMVGVLSIAKIPYNIWFRWFLPLMLILIVVAFFLLIPTIYIKLNGF